jgi:transcriptional regulator with XRE-family HTH domain
MEQKTESEIVKDARFAQGLSLRAMAFKLGVSHTAVWQWEGHGAREFRQPPTLILMNGCVNSLTASSEVD